MKEIKKNTHIAPPSRVHNLVFGVSFVDHAVIHLGHKHVFFETNQNVNKKKTSSFSFHSPAIGPTIVPISSLRRTSAGFLLVAIISPDVASCKRTKAIQFSFLFGGFFFSVLTFTNTGVSRSRCSGPKYLKENRIF